MEKIFKSKSVFFEILKSDEYPGVSASNSILPWEKEILGKYPGVFGSDSILPRGINE